MRLRRSREPDVEKLARKGNVAGLVSALASESLTVRQNAIGALGDCGPEAISPLLSVVADAKESASVKAMAARVLLQREAGAKLIPPLLGAWAASSADPPTQIAMYKMLREATDQAGSDAAPVLRACLDDPDSRVRERAAELLGYLRDTAATEVLSGLISDSDERVRNAAVEALGRIGVDAGQEALFEALSDEDDYTRYKAADALGTSGGMDAVPALVNAVEDRHRGVGIAAIRSLGLLAQRKVDGAVQALVGFLDRDPNLPPRKWTGTDARVPHPSAYPGYSFEAIAAAVLGQSESSAAVTALVSALSSQEDDLRGAGAESLGQIGDPRAVDALVDRLTDSAGWVAAKAARSLGALGSSEAVDALLEALRDSPDADVRQSAAFALGEIGDPSALDGLRAALDDPYVVDEYHEAQDLYLPTSYPVRDAAKEALRRISGGPVSEA